MEELARAGATRCRTATVAQILEGLKDDARRELVLPAADDVVIRMRVGVLHHGDLVNITDRQRRAAAWTRTVVQGVMRPQRHNLTRSTVPALFRTRQR